MRVLFLLVLAMGCGLSAQSLAPEMLLVSKIEAHLSDELARLPNYTCLQTISRFRKPDAKHAQLEALDQVRLEVVYNERREWYGSPGDRSFTLENPVGFIGGGMIGTGAFALEVHNIFLSHASQITYQGEEQVAGRSVLRYGFHLSALLHAMEVSVLGGKGTVGDEGAFWVDRQTLDLLRVEAHVVEIPPYLPLDSLRTRMVYGRTRIGEHAVLLPQQAEMYLAEPLGLESFNRSEFTHCRAFHVSSSVSFEAPEGKTPAVRAPVLTAAAEGSDFLPALLKVTVELTSPITPQDTVGALITGKIVGEVVRKGRRIAADGALVRGRLRRLERYGSGDTFIVGLEFLEVDAVEQPLRFYADLLSMDARPGIRSLLKESVPVPVSLPRKSVTVTVNELPGVATFFVTGPELHVPAGLRTVWRTRGILR